MSEAAYFCDELLQEIESEAVAWEMAQKLQTRLVMGWDLGGPDLSSIVYGRIHRTHHEPLLVMIDGMDYHDIEMRVIAHLKMKADIRDELLREEPMLRYNRRAVEMDYLLHRVEKEYVEEAAFVSGREKWERHTGNPRAYETKREWRRRLVHPHATPRSR
jgi:hypothetical protein